MPLGSAEGTVPARDARYLITMVGILGSVISGTVGAVLTLRIGPRLGGVALAELILALAAVVLISVCSRVRGRDSQEARHQNDP
jgi:threonine/homoserine efflux transporter RhtA